MEINKIYQGDALQKLREFPDESIDMVMTSPPYWALRDYGVDGQLGLESTFDEYLDKLCAIFDEVKRVLKKEGTCWVNIGDTYGGSWGNYGARNANQRTRKSERWERKGALPQRLKPPTINMPEKCLLQIPSRFAIKMVDRGWTLRNEIIWHKSNGTPDSAKDRFTVNFEKLFFFVKNKRYFFRTQYDQAKYIGHRQEKQRRIVKYTNQDLVPGNTPHIFASRGHIRWQIKDGQKVCNKKAVWTIQTNSFKGAHFATFPEKLVITPIKAGSPRNGIVLDPFLGSGTTALVAQKLGRNWVGIELNGEYIKMAEERLAQKLLI